MYHNIDDICRKIDVIKAKADKLQIATLIDEFEPLDTGLPDPQLKFQLDDIQALCADIANDKGHY